MASNKQVIFPNLGLAMNPQPDAIQDGQASDILNLRFNKLGYMTNRNGVKAFDFVEEVIPVASSLTEKTWGAMQVGEFILSHEVLDYATFTWAHDMSDNQLRAGAVRIEDHDKTAEISYTKFDRFMVFALRNEGEQMNLYLVPLVPLEPGDYLSNQKSDIRVSIYANNNDIAFFCAPETAEGRAKGPLLAPSRRLSRSIDGSWIDENGTIDDLNWIDHYVDFIQYNKSFIICDRTNGDMIIRDRWDDTETGNEKSHDLRLQENTKAFFDVDCVRFDPRVGEGEQNASGVEHGMALYHFYLTRKRAITTIDNVTDGFINQSGDKPSFQVVDTGTDVFFDIGTEMTQRLNRSSAFARGFTSDVVNNDGNHFNGLFKALLVNKQKDYVFSTYRQETEFDSLLDVATLYNPEVPRKFDENGAEIINIASDVYIWNDLRLTYYPCSGKDEGEIYLRDYDREFSKKVPINPRIVKLKTRLGVEQTIPLGVWGYRFVWDMGNGEYSAPSSVLQIPDKLWSAIPDEEIVDYSQEYHRYYTYSGTGGESGWEERSSYDGNWSPGISNLTANAIYTNAYNKIRQKLYNQPFGYSTDTAIEQTLITVYHHSDELVLDAVIAESAYLSMKCDEEKWKLNDISIDWTFQHKLAIPLVSQDGSEYTLNSIFNAQVGAFNSNGFMRRALVPQGIIDYEIVLPGDSMNFGPGLGDVGYDILTAYCDVQSTNVWSDTPYGDDGESLWMEDGSVLHPTNGSPDEWLRTRHLQAISKQDNFYFNLVRNISTDNNGHSAIEQPTICRFVKDQDKRLSWTKLDADPDVVSRLINTGVAEFVLAQNGDKGVLANEVWWHDLNAVSSAQRQFKNLLQYGYDREWSLTGNNDGALDRGQIINITSGTYKPHTAGILCLYDSFIQRFMMRESTSITPLDTDYNMRGGNAYTINVQHVEQPPPDPPKHPEDPTIDNLTVIMHLPGERLMIPEQLTAYFPASHLFNAPRAYFKIAAEDIPSRAKRLLIYRTLCSHDNQWQPDSFGYVDAVAVNREETLDFVASGIPSKVSVLKTNVAEDLTYFDEKKDTDLDFTKNPNDHDGLIHALQSRFGLPLNERMYYAHFKETYQPYSPRAFVVNDYQDNVAGSGTLQPSSPATSLHPQALIPMPMEIVVNVQSGTFVEGETITGASSGATATIWKIYGSLFQLKDIVGAFRDNGAIEVINGGTSGAVGWIANTDQTLGGFKYYYHRWPQLSYNSTWRELKAHDTEDNRKAGYSPMFQGKIFQYFVVFKDKIGEFSAIKGDNDDALAATVLLGYPDYAGQVPTHFMQADFSAVASGTLGAVAFCLTGYPYQDIYEECEIYRSDVTAGVGSTKYYKIGHIKSSDEGIFIDTGIPNGLPWDKYNPDFANYPISPPMIEDYRDSVRWSEVYSPSEIKLESVESFLIGNGDGITGIAPIDGSLLIFKERSVIRAMTGGGVDITRRDIISNQYGCIAPETIVPYNEHVYFLSWFGLMRYNNNEIVKADGAFSYELDRRLRNEIDGIRDPAIRDASCTLNPVYKELYLNIPTAPDPTYDVENKGTKGHIYVINLETNLVTKFGYETGDTDRPRTGNPEYWSEGPIPRYQAGETADPTIGTWPRTQGRLYYANSYGQLWSADILPRNQRTLIWITDIIFQVGGPGLQVGEIVDGLVSAAVGKVYDVTGNDIDGYRVHVLILNKKFNTVGAETLRGRTTQAEVDVTFSGDIDYTGGTSSLVYLEAPTNLETDDYQPGIDIDGTPMPDPLLVRGLIQTWVRTKAFNMGDPSQLKRVWKVYAEVVAGKNIRITMEADNSEYDNDQRSGGGFGDVGKLEFIPPFKEGVDRGERITFEVASRGITEIQNMSFIWKTPNPYYR